MTLDLRSVWQQLGWPGRGGAAALLAGLVWVLLLAPARQAALDDLQVRVEAARTEVQRLQRGARSHGAAVAAAPTAQAFEAAFPAAAEREARIAALWQQAQQHGLVPARSEFRLADEPGLGLLRYRIVWPVTAAYASLRAGIAAALANDPALALDTLELTRSDERPGLLTAQLTWSMWMRDTAAAVRSVEP